MKWNRWLYMYIFCIILFFHEWSVYENWYFFLSSFCCQRKQIIDNEYVHTFFSPWDNHGFRMRVSFKFCVNRSCFLWYFLRLLISDEKIFSNFLCLLLFISISICLEFPLRYIFFWDKNCASNMSSLIPFCCCQVGKIHCIQKNM